MPGIGLDALIAADDVVLDAGADSAGAALARLAAIGAARSGAGERMVLDALVARERLGSTGIGHGVAIPHARLAGVPRLIGALLRLAHPVDFLAADLQPCDLFVLLLAPLDAAGDHLKALALLSRRLREPTVRAALRRAADAAALRAALLGAG